MVTGPLFCLGSIVATPGAIQDLEDTHQSPLVFILRHVGGDWGEVCPEDAQENNLSVREGYRILSAYRTNQGVKIWVITEADRSVTTLLLPEEY